MRLFIVIIVFALALSCSDQVDTFYPDYNSIISDQYDQKGWIPAKLIPPSTSNLHSRTNLDLNSFLIRYNFDKRDLSLILNYLEPCNLEFTKMHRLRIPQWWFKNQSNLTTFKLKSDSITRACAIDTELGIFYYWGKFE